MNDAVPRFNSWKKVNPVVGTRELVERVDRASLFLAVFLLSIINPITLLLFEFSATFTVVVPLTLIIWFFTKKDQLAHIASKSVQGEILLALIIYALNIGRNLLLSNVKPVYGLTDMALSFMTACLAFYGFRGLRHFLLPSMYLLVLIVGYELEFRLEQVSGLQIFLAQVITSIMCLLTPTYHVGNAVTIKTIADGYQGLVIDASCTGLKGVIAYGSLSVIMMMDLQASNSQKIISTVLGLAGTFLVNILRLLVIFLSCYFFSVDVALAVHTYLGYGLFMIWTIVFWHLSKKFILTG